MKQSPINLLCEIRDFKNALKNASSLLEEKQLKERGIQSISRGIIICRNFLEELYQNDYKSYPEFICFLQKFGASKEVSLLTGGLGKLLDVIQILKSNTLRNKRIKESICRSLQRTGHLYLWEELSDKERHYYQEELINGTALFHLLEVVSLYEPAQSSNPINTLRNSMGARLPEEYFAELLAGWVIEDVFKNFFKKKGFRCFLEGPDKQHKLIFVRPEEMGYYDFKIVADNKIFYLELQRLAKLNKETDSKKKELMGKIKTYLKEHKYMGGDNRNKILILWIGIPFQKTYKKWAQKILFISDIKRKKDVVFKNEYLYLPERFLNEALSWEELKQKSSTDLFRLLENA